ncbi:MAG: tetraacyldisaccharide 4'-kinase, partial [Gemmatimonadetes bacterium]|nr:tetraacyldisaccharide 4'-kinase [Gemmatimonadota bacterium]
MIERRYLKRAHARRARLVGALYGDEGGFPGVMATRPAANPRPSRRAIHLAATPPAYLFERVSSVRSALAHARRIRLRRPVLCVGNVGLGGTGKTPFVRWLCRALLERGLRPAVLTRGYGWVGRRDSPLVLGGSSQAELAAGAMPRPPVAGEIPDEAVLFLRDGVAVAAHPRRSRAAAALALHGVEPDAYLLDDGLQHRQMRADWTLALISARELAAPRRTLPAGPFREGWGALRRADRLAIT